jgi:hypothetical protein
VIAANGSATIAVGVTVVATLVVVGLVAGLFRVLAAARQLRADAEELQRESRRLLGELDGTLTHAGRELARVDDLIGSAEALTDTVGQASRLAYASVANPVIKVLAFGRGTARASRRLRGRDAPEMRPGTRRAGGE